MTDKEKTLAFIEERIKWNEDMMQRDPKPSDIGRIEEAKCIRRFINSLQEKPVSIWHDSNKEQPNYASTVAIWNPKCKNGEIISRCTEVYSDRIWAYIDDLLKI